MAFTVTDLEDLLALLREHPQWRDAVRREVLTTELLELPDLVRGLTEDVRALTTKVAALAEQQYALAAAQAALTAEVRALSEDVRALVASNERAWGAIERLEGNVAVLRTDVDGLKTDMAEVKADVAVLKTDVAVLKTDMAEVKTDLTGVKTDLGMLKGRDTERAYRELAPSYFRGIVLRAHSLTPDERMELVDGAVERGELSETEADDLALADVFVRGRLRSDGSEVMLVVEVSWGIGDTDIERAVRRAALLQRTGRAALPVVAGYRIDPLIANAAHAAQVWHVIEGRATAPQSA